MVTDCGKPLTDSSPQNVLRLAVRRDKKYNRLNNCFREHEIQLRHSQKHFFQKEDSCSKLKIFCQHARHCRLLTHKITRSDEALRRHKCLITRATDAVDYRKKYDGSKDGLVEEKCLISLKINEEQNRNNNIALSTAFQTADETYTDDSCFKSHFVAMKKMERICLECFEFLSLK